jgi:hypothetical protein
MTMGCSGSPSEKTCAVRKISLTGELRTSDDEPASCSSPACDTARRGASPLTEQPSAGASSTSEILTEMPVLTPLLR